MDGGFFADGPYRLTLLREGILFDIKRLRRERGDLRRRQPTKLETAFKA